MLDVGPHQDAVRGAGAASLRVFLSASVVAAGRVLGWACVVYYGDGGTYNIALYGFISAKILFNNPAMFAVDFGYDSTFIDESIFEIAQ